MDKRTLHTIIDYLGVKEGLGLVGEERPESYPCVIVWEGIKYCIIYGKDLRD